MKKSKPNKSKKFVLALIVLALIGAGAYLYIRHRSDNKRSETPAQTAESIKLAPATDAEKKQSEDNKRNLPDNKPEPTPPPSGLVQSTVTITSVDANPVRARVSGVVEDTDNGCTATFTKGSESFSVSSASVANVSHTLCAIRPDRTLSSGQWQIVVSYKSNTAEGTSDPQTITVP